MPTSFMIGQVSLYGANILLVLSWLVFSFLFWRALRRWGISEDRIFDLTFYATLSALLCGRLVFVATHWHLFAGKSLLLLAALWVVPGASFLGALVGAVVTLVVLVKRYKVRLGILLDSLSVSLSLPFIVGESASLLGGWEVGTKTRLPWGVQFIGHEGLRHPIQLYEMIALLCISVVIGFISTLSIKKKWPYGIVGVWFFLLYASLGFVLEFGKASRVYWGNVTLNQWVLIGIFAESIGVLYVRGGGREMVRPAMNTIGSIIQQKGTALYATISRRFTKKTS